MALFEVFNIKTRWVDLPFTWFQIYFNLNSRLKTADNQSSRHKKCVRYNKYFTWSTSLSKPPSVAIISRKSLRSAKNFSPHVPPQLFSKSQVRTLTRQLQQLYSVGSWFGWWPSLDQASAVGQMDSYLTGPVAVKQAQIRSLWSSMLVQLVHFCLVSPGDVVPEGSSFIQFQVCLVLLAWRLYREEAFSLNLSWQLWWFRVLTFNL